jgi:hypothetical protein
MRTRKNSNNVKKIPIQDVTFDIFLKFKCNFNTLDPDPEPCLKQEAEYVAEAAADVGLDLLQGRQDIGFLLAPEGHTKNNRSIISSLVP